MQYPANHVIVPYLSILKTITCSQTWLFSSAIENFQYQTWRDFSDVRLIDPTVSYPIIEVEVSLNFFPGNKLIQLMKALFRWERLEKNSHLLLTLKQN